MSDPSPLNPQVFTGIFTAEMVLKLLAMDPYYYFQVRLCICLLMIHNCSYSNIFVLFVMAVGGLEHL